MTLWCRKWRAKTYLYELSTDGVAVNRYTADGSRIIATPTGSTGYSISAGGPVVDPCIVCCDSDLCAHMLSVRSAVLSSNRNIRIKLDGEYGNADAVVYGGR